MPIAGIALSCTLALLVAACSRDGTDVPNAGQQDTDTANNDTPQNDGVDTIDDPGRGLATMLRPQPDPDAKPGCKGATPDPSCDLPDLTLDETALRRSLNVTEEFLVKRCDLEEGLVGDVGLPGKPNVRRLLRFTVSTPNVGNVDLQLGDPQLPVRTYLDPDRLSILAASTPNFQLFAFSTCHGHFHFTGYAQYTLFASKKVGGHLVADESVPPLVQTRKMAFCLEDSEHANPTHFRDPAVKRKITDAIAKTDSLVADATADNFYHCSLQGISVGFADTYATGLDGQWIDITGVPAGDYILDVKINPDRVIRELRADNNDARVPVHIKDRQSRAHR
jgi:hypothetical protein